MFSFKKSKISRRFAWIRGRVGSLSRSSVDVEAAPSLSASASGVRDSNERQPVLQINVGTSESVGGRGNPSASSQSEPVLVHYSIPEVFTPGGENGRGVPKSQSAGAVFNEPVSSEGNSGSTIHDGNDQGSGVRRRCINNSVGNETSEGPSGVSGSGISGSEVNNILQVDNNDNAEGMEMMPIDNHVQQDQLGVVNRPQYVHAYFDVMYKTGTSGRVPIGWRDRKEWWMSTVKLFLMILLLLVSTASCWESFGNAKLSILHFMNGEGLSFFVDFCFYMFCLFTKLYSVYRFNFLNDETDKMLNAIQEYEEEYDSQADCHCRCWKWIVLGICFWTLVISIMETFFERGFEEWTLESVGWEQSYAFSLQIFIWRYEGIKDKVYHLAWTYGRPETYNGWYGLISAVCNIASNFQMGTLRDLVLITVFVIFLIVFGLMKGIKETMENASEDDVDACRRLQAKREQLWKQHRKVKLVISASNLVLDWILLLLHLDNLLLYGYFASLCMEREDVAALVYVHYAFNLLKAELTYLLAVRISVENVNIKKWLLNWGCHSGKIEVDGAEYDVGLLLYAIDTDPMGIGSSIFKITPELHAKFLTMAVTLVFFLADEKRRMKGNED